MTSLLSKKCILCEGGTPPLTPEKSEKLLGEISGWELKRERMYKKFKFKDFKKAIEFVNKVASLAEEEAHHPNISINYNKVSFEIWTHAIGGLSENDFILAAKIDNLS
jgi:4a-hydroxytetrahydrobiopterin dehydratase